jgi:U3 small nucleolar RNA-associated protein 23
LQQKPFQLYITRSSLRELQTLSEQVTNETKKQLFCQARQWGLDECDVILEDKDIPTTAKASSRDDDKTLKSNHTMLDLGQPGQDVLALVEQAATLSSHSRHASPVVDQYMVATQDEILLDTLRQLGMTPLFRLARAVLLLESPSKSAQAKFQTREHQKWTAAGTKPEQALVECVKAGQETIHAPPKQVRRKRKAKGPNPLSCKKRKTPTENTATTTNKRKRRRKQNKNSSSQVTVSET